MRAGKEDRPSNQTQSHLACGLSRAYAGHPCLPAPDASPNIFTVLMSSPHLLAFSAFSKKGTKKNQRMAVGRGVTFTEVPSLFSVYLLISSSHFTDGKTEPQRGPGLLSMTGYWLAGVS